MSTRARDPGAQQRLDLGEGGFTLIELLVVIIIIGILAAIAIPIFMNQRTQGYDAAAKSDLNSLAQLQEGYLIDAMQYGGFTDLQASGEKSVASPGMTLTIKYDGATGYCLSAKQANSPNTWYYDSQGGGLQAKGAAGCPVTVGATDGGTLTG